MPLYCPLLPITTLYLSFTVLYCPLLIFTAFCCPLPALYCPLLHFTGCPLLQGAVALQRSGRYRIGYRLHSHISHGKFKRKCRGSTEMSQQMIFVDRIAFFFLGGGGRVLSLSKEIGKIRAFRGHPAVNHNYRSFDGCSYRHMCIHIYVHINTHVYVCTYVCMCVCVRMTIMYVCIYVCMYVCMCVCMCECMDRSMDGWMDDWMDVCIHIDGYRYRYRITYVYIYIYVQSKGFGAQVRIHAMDLYELD